MILRWILSSCVLILVVALLCRSFGERISGKLRYAMWLPVLLRLLIPVSLFHYDMPLSPEDVYPEGKWEKPIYFEEKLTERSLEPELALYISAEGDVYVPSPVDLANSKRIHDTDLHRKDRLLIWILSAVWFVGATVTSTVFCLTNYSFGRRLRKNRAAADVDYILPVYTVRGLSTPCLFGTIRPAIYIPDTMLPDATAMAHAMAHECAHYEQGDHLWGMLRCVALSIHWWNPLAWWALELSKRDGELAADEGALQILPLRHRKAYGETLLSLVTLKIKPAELFGCVSRMSMAKTELFRRIRRIMHRTGYPVRYAVVAVLAVITVTVCCFTGPAAQAVSSVDGVRYKFLTLLPHEPDLNHDGIPETLSIGYAQLSSGSRSYVLEVRQGKEVLWCDTADFTPLDPNALFLTKVDGKDYLLRVEVEAAQRNVFYYFILYYLDERSVFYVYEQEYYRIDLSGAGTCTRGGKPCDPEDVAQAVERVNGYLANGYQILNTDPAVLESFRRSGTMRYDSWWLDELEDMIEHSSSGAEIIAEAMLTAPNVSLQYQTGSNLEFPGILGFQNLQVDRAWSALVGDYIDWENWRGSSGKLSAAGGRAVYHQLNRFQVEAAASGCSYVVESMQLLGKDTEKEELLVTYTADGVSRQVKMTFYGVERFTWIDVEPLP